MLLIYTKDGRRFQPLLSVYRVNTSHESRIVRATRTLLFVITMYVFFSQEHPSNTTQNDMDDIYACIPCQYINIITFRICMCNYIYVHEQTYINTISMLLLTYQYEYHHKNKIDQIFMIINVCIMEVEDYCQYQYNIV